MRHGAELRLIPRYEPQAKGSGIRVTHLHGGAISFAADKCGGDVCVSIFIIQVYHIGHAAWQEQLIPLICLALEEHAVNIAAYKKTKQQVAPRTLYSNSCHLQSTYSVSATMPTAMHAFLCFTDSTQQPCEVGIIISF